MSSSSSRSVVDVRRAIHSPYSTRTAEATLCPTAPTFRSAAAYRPRTTSTPDRTRSSFALGSLPTRTVNPDLSRVTICETFDTDSFGSPVALSDRRTLPGADAHFTLLVKATQTAVAIRLRFKASPSTGRRKPGFDPRGLPRSAHHTSP